VRTAEREVARRAVEDVDYFARAVVGEPLWPHQLEAARSPARVRCLRAGRQVGKSRLLAVLALWEAFRAPDRHVLLLSASESNALDLLAEVTALAMGSELLRGSVSDDSLSRLVLDNGSWIRSIPASPRQARGKSIDVLVLDEACWISEDVWRAAKYSQAARPGSRLLLASSPYGRRDAFFAQHDRMGERGLVDIGGVTVETFVWPSTVSPLVREAGLVEFWRRTDPPRMFAAEVMAEWQSDEGAFFEQSEIDNAVADYELIQPGRARGQMVAGGIDWGLSDANVLVLLAVLADGDLNNRRHPSEPVFFIPYLEERFRMPYGAFIDRVLDTADTSAGGFYVRTLASETNGVGAYPSEALAAGATARGTRMTVVKVHTDNRRKESGYGAIKGLLQAGRLVLPRHPSLLRQLAAMEFSTTDTGATRIQVPERSGHDDVADALMQAVSCVRHTMGRRPDPHLVGAGEVIVTEGGTSIHERPRCAPMPEAFIIPQGRQGGDGW
jgi:hypothetical protein